MPDCIAVINAGSSSVKFAIYAPGDALTLYRGQVEGIGTSPGDEIAGRIAWRG
jgi:acetate kinase